MGKQDGNPPRSDACFPGGSSPKGERHQGSRRIHPASLWPCSDVYSLRIGPILASGFGFSSAAVVVLAVSLYAVRAADLAFNAGLFPQVTQSPKSACFARRSKVFHCPQLTQIFRNSRSLCIIHLQIPSVMPLEMRKVQAESACFARRSKRFLSQLHQPRLLVQRQHLQKQPLQRFQVVLAKVANGAEVRRVVCRQHPEGDVLVETLGDAA